MGYDEIDEEIYAGVKVGILLVSEVYGIEVFQYESEAERVEGVRRICSGIEEAYDGVDRDIAFVTDGDIRHVGTWDGEEWEVLDLPPSAALSAS